jgi:hypothetical protein
VWWGVRGGAGTLIATQTTGSYHNVGGTFVETAFVVEGAYTFEMTDTYEDGICCQHGIGEFNIAVNGEPVAVGGNGDFGDVVQESFVVGLSTYPTVVYRLDVVYDNYSDETSWSLKSLTTDEVVAASGFNVVTESGFIPFFLSGSGSVVGRRVPAGDPRCLR